MENEKGIRGGPSKRHIHPIINIEVSGYDTCIYCNWVRSECITWGALASAQQEGKGKNGVPFG